MRHLIYLTFLIVLTSCHKEKQNTSLSGPIFGTSYNFIFEGKSNSVNQEEIDSLFAVINQSMSTYMADSDISKLIEMKLLILTSILLAFLIFQVVFIKKPLVFLIQPLEL